MRISVNISRYLSKYRRVQPYTGAARGWPEIITLGDFTSDKGKMEKAKQMMPQELNGVLYDAMAVANA